MGVLTATDVKAILKKNGIESIDQLAQQVADNSDENGHVVDIHDKTAKGGSWIIKVWEIKPTPNLLPDSHGGDIIKQRLNVRARGGS